MGIFSPKQEIKLNEFCSNYYERVFFEKKIEDQNVEDYFFHLHSGLSKADSCFKDISQELFIERLLALQFETFSLAWMHSFGADLAVKLSHFTKQFLLERGKGDAWEAMGYYNNAINVAIKNSQDEYSYTLYLKKKLDVADIFINSFRARGEEATDILRVLNLLFSESIWDSGRICYFLILSFCHQLGLGSGPDYFGPNDEAQLGLIAWIRGQYEGAMRALKGIRIID